MQDLKKAKFGKFTSLRGAGNGCFSKTGDVFYPVPQQAQPPIEDSQKNEDIKRN
ncbi:hypothetical protein F2Q68_00001850 [Brassica cretica]|uniref:Uncharacterized protein n=1 Tax=Brassica cretica TaxID=69181 RepID=A0A8S9JCP5_BRACR|nr:hypothetical protein F2Q68_00001850 [Brassica cretica]